MAVDHQLLWLFVLPLTIACIAWTVTHEQVFAEPREYCVKRSKDCKSLLVRKFFYLFTCEYCFSHYVTVFVLILTKYHLLLPDWRGYVLAGFSLVWIANFYMSIYNRIRVDLKKENTEIKVMEKENELK